MKKHRTIGRLILLAAVLYIAAGLVSVLITRTYNIKSPKIDRKVTFAVITDLHDCRYGKDQKRLLRKIDAAEPDAILLVGDIFDEETDGANTMALLTGLSGRYPMYFVTGNHEHYSRTFKTEKLALIEACGVTILSDGAADFTVNGQTVTLLGINDPADGRNTDAHLKAVKPLMSDSGFNLLLAHRPEMFTKYANAGFDLVLSGHEHGGQWRLPGIVNGVYAPFEGFFPDYAGGLYTKGGTRMIVSRGLAKNTWVPRFYNPKELVVVHLIPEGE